MFMELCPKEHYIIILSRKSKYFETWISYLLQCPVKYFSSHQEAFVDFIILKQNYKKKAMLSDLNTPLLFCHYATVKMHYSHQKGGRINLKLWSSTHKFAFMDSFFYQ